MSAADIADIVGVRERQVHHWVAGTHEAQGAAEPRLYELHYIVEFLKLLMPVEAIGHIPSAWLRAIVDSRVGDTIVVPSDNSPPTQVARTTRLSEFELRVDSLLSEGLTYKEIAARLCTSPKAIDNARSRINRKKETT